MSWHVHLSRLEALPPSGRKKPSYHAYWLKDVMLFGTELENLFCPPTWIYSFPLMSYQSKVKFQDFWVKTLNLDIWKNCCRSPTSCAVSWNNPEWHKLYLCLSNRAQLRSRKLTQCATSLFKETVLTETNCSPPSPPSLLSLTPGLCSKPSETLHLHYRSLPTLVCQKRDPAKGLQ